MLEYCDDAMRDAIKERSEAAMKRKRAGRAPGGPSGTFSIGMAFVGTVIGAGFASGQETMQFFGNFGERGVGGLLIAALAFCIYACLIMTLSRRLHTGNYLDLLNPHGWRWLNPVIDVVLFGGALGVQVVMVAGCGVLLETELGIPRMLGGALLLLLNGAVCWGDGKGIARGFNISVPILVIGSIWIAVYAIRCPPAAGLVRIPHTTNPMIGNWMMAAVLFVFHNMLTSIGVLAPLAKDARSTRSVVRAGAMGGISLGVMGLALVLCIIQNDALIWDAPMPMVTIARALSPVAGHVYTLIMLCAIFSTTIGLTLSMGTRLGNTAWFRPSWHGRYIVGMSVLCLAGSRAGFVSLIGMVYPFFGYLSIAAFFMMVYHLYLVAAQGTQAAPWNSR